MAIELPSHEAFVPTPSSPGQPVMTKTSWRSMAEQLVKTVANGSTDGKIPKKLKKWLTDV
ncbi:hypothetical protein [uncultured Roseibium sp.]|uniref:hypothetical protein n=1 Tax=uncultured Roseibium sp. TaxID=1936171 RepID=UPI00321794CA